MVSLSLSFAHISIVYIYIYIVWFSRLLKKGKDSFCKKFSKKNGINVKFQVERESSGRNVF